MMKTDVFRIRHWVYALAVLVVTTFAYGCNNDKNKSGRELLAGESSKTWRATKETNNSGENQKLDREERNEVMQFYANGTFTMNTANQAANGTWTYNDDTKTLAMQFADANVTENFQVQDLNSDKMSLKAGDGSVLTMKAD